MIITELALWTPKSQKKYSWTPSDPPWTPGGPCGPRSRTPDLYHLELELEFINKCSQKHRFIREHSLRLKLYSLNYINLKFLKGKILFTDKRDN